MDIIILGVAALSLAHFIYEGIIAPSLRMKLRNDMFKLRDEVRTLRIAKDERCTAEAFEIAHAGINQYLNRLHWVTISFGREFSRAMRHGDFRSDVERRKAVLEACESPELNRIVHKANTTIELAFFANAGGWAFYLIPVGLIAVAVKRINKRVAQVFATPESRTMNFMPQTATN